MNLDLMGTFLPYGTVGSYIAKLPWESSFSNLSVPANAIGMEIDFDSAFLSSLWLGF